MSRSVTIKGIIVTLLLLCIVPAAKAQEQVNPVQCKADLKMWTGNFESKTMLSDGWTVNLPELGARDREMTECADTATVTGKGKHQKSNYDDAMNYRGEAVLYTLSYVQRMRRYIMRHSEWEIFETENIAQYGTSVIDPAPLVRHALTPDECWKEASDTVHKSFVLLPFDTFEKRNGRMAECNRIELESLKEELLAVQHDYTVGIDRINYIDNLHKSRMFTYYELGHLYSTQEAIQLGSFLTKHHEYTSFVTEDEANRAPPTLSSAPETTPITQIILPYDDLNGSMLVKISVNGRETTATFDSGADIVVANLTKFGITPDSKMNVQLADGQVVSKDAGEGVVCAGTPHVCLRVGVCDNSADADVLLGQSFLSHFMKVMVDRRQHVIVLEP